MTILTADAPKLNRSEWKQMASTLLGVDVRGTGRRESLSELGFNDRQIAALGLLSL